MATVKLKKNQKRLPTTLQVTLRSLNLREDIFDARYRSSNTRLSNEFKNTIGLPTTSLAPLGFPGLSRRAQESARPSPHEASPQQRALRVINIDLKNFSRQSDQLRRSLHNNPQPLLPPSGADAALPKGQRLTVNMQPKGDHFLQTQTTL